MSKVAVGQAHSDLANRERLRAIPENIHDGTFELAQPVHGVTLSSGPHAEKTRVRRAQQSLRGLSDRERQVATHVGRTVQRL